jgi:hypothetical protein
VMWVVAVLTALLRADGGDASPSVTGGRWPVLQRCLSRVVPCA